MRQTLAAALMLGATGCGPASAVPVYDRVQAATLTLVIGDSGCSGTAVARNVILTASHCFPEAQPKTLLANGELCEIRRIIKDTTDHALVTVGGCKFKVTAKVGKPAKVGDRVFTWSSPYVFRGLLIFGTVAGMAPGELIKAPTTLYDLNLWQGSSGGGIFNERGELVAVVSIGTRPYRLMGSFPMGFTARQWKEATR